MALRDQLLGTGSSIYNMLGSPLGSAAGGLLQGAAGISGLAGGNIGGISNLLQGANTLGAFGDTFSGLGSALSGLGPIGMMALPVTMGLGMGLGPNAFNMAEDQRQLGMMQTARNRISNTLQNNPAAATGSGIPIGSNATGANQVIGAPDLETAWLGYDQKQNPWQNLGTNTVDVPGLGTANIAGISDYLSNPVETWPGARPGIAPEHGTRFINDLASELGAKATEAGLTNPQETGTLMEPGGLFSILSPRMNQEGTLDSFASGKHLNLPVMGGNWADINQHAGWRQAAREWFPGHAEWLSTHMTNPGHPGAEDYWNYDRDIGYDTGD